MLLLIADGIGTALATGLGAVPVFFLGERAEVLRLGDDVVRDDRPIPLERLAPEPTERDVAWAASIAASG
jgi:hypothetical protein